MKTTILVDGGAIAFGNNDREYGGWAARLHRDSIAVNEESPDKIEIINNARREKTLAGVLRGRKAFGELSYEERLKKLRMSSDIGSRLVSIVGVCHDEVLQRELPADFQRHVGNLCMIAQTQKVPLIMIGPNLIDTERESADFFSQVWSYNNDHIRARADVMALTIGHRQKMLPSEYLSYIDTPTVFGAFGPQLLSEDGINPNAIGHSLIHEEIKKGLVQLGVRL